MNDPAETIKNKVVEANRRRGLLPSEGGRVIAGVSGGADSVCLLHVLLSLRSELKIEVAVAHLNHAARGEESDADEKFVEALAAQLGVEFASDKLRPEDIRLARRKSPEAAWRELRCKFLHDVAREKKAARIALGHNADDQAETILLRLIRGSSATGILGMDSIYGMVIRPLLTVTRAEIEDYCRAHQLEFRSDSSNMDLRFPRNKVRRKLIPYLEGEFNPRARENIFRFAEKLRADVDYIETAAKGALAEATVSASGDRAVLRPDALNLPAPLLSRVLRNAALHILGTDGWRLDADHIDAMMDLVLTPGAGRAVSLPASLRMIKKYDSVEIERVALPGATPAQQSPPMSSSAKMPARDGVFAPEGIGFEFTLEVQKVAGDSASLKTILKNNDPMVAYFDIDRLCDAFELRFWEKGDAFQPLGMSGKKKLSDFFVDARVDRDARARVPLLVSAGEIAWVVGLRIAQPFRVTDSTVSALKITAHKIT